MSNIRYYNQSGPFWDFIAGLEDTDFNNHPFARAWTAWSGNNARNATEAEPAAATPGEDTDRTMSDNDAEGEATATATAGSATAAAAATGEWDPFDSGFFPFGRPGHSRRGRGGPGFGRGGWGGPRHAHGSHRGPGAFSVPPPFSGPIPHHGGPPPPPPPPGMGPENIPTPPMPPMPPMPAMPASTPGEGPAPPPVDSDDERGPGHRRHSRMRGGHGGRGRSGGRHGRRDGPSGGHWGSQFNMNNLADFFQNQIFGEDGRNNNRSTTDSTGATAPSGDFVPPVDVFDTEPFFVIDVSLPGAKKTDIAVAWDAEKSELNVTGVVHRPGDEAILKTLALDERKIGAFARKVRLGSRANPAQVDAEGITAKLEDGVLRVMVPKEEKDFEMVHKVEID